MEISQSKGDTETSSKTRGWYRWLGTNDVLNFYVMKDMAKLSQSLSCSNQRDGQGLVPGQTVEETSVETR